jgi:hypothetical protein
MTWFILGLVAGYGIEQIRRRLNYWKYLRRLNEAAEKYNDGLTK